MENLFHEKNEISAVDKEILTPSYHGELCRHNGENPDYEIACDECNFYLLCFPDWKELFCEGNSY